MFISEKSLLLIKLIKIYIRYSATIITLYYYNNYYFLHGKNSFAERSNILAGYRLKK